MGNTTERTVKIDGVVLTEAQLRAGLKELEKPQPEHGHVYSIFESGLTTGSPWLVLSVDKVMSALTKAQLSGRRYLAVQVSALSPSVTVDPLIDDARYNLKDLGSLGDIFRKAGNNGR